MRDQDHCYSARIHCRDFEIPTSPVSRGGDPHWADLRNSRCSLRRQRIGLRIETSGAGGGGPEDAACVLYAGTAPGSSRIERFFRTVNEMFLCDLDGYTARTGRKATLTLDSLEKQFHTFLLEVYHRRPSSEGKLSPKEPQANVKTSRAFKSELSPLDNQNHPSSALSVDSVSRLP
jgi:hypothetical protein